MIFLIENTMAWILYLSSAEKCPALEEHILQLNKRSTGKNKAVYTSLLNVEESSNGSENTECRL